MHRELVRRVAVVEHERTSQQHVVATLVALGLVPPTSTLEHQPPQPRAGDQHPRWRCASTVSVGLCLDICIDICIGIHVDMRVDMYIDLRVDYEVTVM